MVPLQLSYSKSGLPSYDPVDCNQRIKSCLMKISLSTC
jgi:hypothetical protein